jgi:hypothetical protein
MAGVGKKNFAGNFSCQMKRTSLILVFLMALAAQYCRPKAETHKAPKGELAFLLQYNSRLPSDVGFLSNHIMERRLANLLKNDFEKFTSNIHLENLIIVDTATFVVHAVFPSDSARNKNYAVVTIDVMHDAIWLDYEEKHFAESPSLLKP